MKDISYIKDEIKSVCDIVELISQFVQLKKVGKNYVGLCPFHSEKEPSFTVSPERQLFHCFGCKKGGDIFKFWMEYHNVSFFEAIKDLAERYNIDIGDEPDYEVEERDKLFEINEIANNFFKDILYNQKQGERGRRYLKERGIDDELSKEIGLGYAPDSWDSLYNFLLKRKIDINLAVKAGLLIKRESGDGYYDRFRDRVIFPIFDIRGRVVGFGGRTIGNGSPKYLNTPETPIFHKGNLLYGINFSYKSIREKKKVIIVEGYMDWIALKKYGIENAVATLGTALTQNHIRRLKGYANEAIVIFDSDEAGKKAALRSLPLFANEGMPAKVLVLPDGHDPDTFLNQYGKDAFLELLNNSSKPLIDFYLDMEIGEKIRALNIKDEEKTGILKNILSNLSFIEDGLTKGIYVSKLAAYFGIKEDLLWKELKRISYGKGSAIEEEIKRERSAKIIGDLQILSLAIFHSETIPSLIRCNAEILLFDPSAKIILKEIFKIYEEKGEISLQEIHERLEDEQSRAFLREFLERPFIVYEKDEIEQALSDIEKKAYKKKIIDSLKKKKGDIKSQSELIKNLKGGI